MRSGSDYALSIANAGPDAQAIRTRPAPYWKNRHRVRHNAASLARRDARRLFRTRTVGFRGEATARAPRTRGTYRYLCTIHPQMRGVLAVR
jgi:plastocyanin